MRLICSAEKSIILFGIPQQINSNILFGITQ